MNMCTNYLIFIPVLWEIISNCFNCNVEMCLGNIIHSDECNTVAALINESSGTVGNGNGIQWFNCLKLFDH